MHLQRTAHELLIIARPHGDILPACRRIRGLTQKEALIKGRTHGAVAVVRENKPHHIVGRKAQTSRQIELQQRALARLHGRQPLHAVPAAPRNNLRGQLRRAIGQHQTTLRCLTPGELVDLVRRMELRSRKFAFIGKRRAPQSAAIRVPQPICCTALRHRENRAVFLAQQQTAG